MSPRRILVAGAGYVGARLGEVLAARGDEVLCVRRSSEGLPQSVTPISADLTDRAALGGIGGKLDALVFSAGPGESTPEAYRRTYVHTLGCVLDAFAERARRVLFVSSTAVYAQADGGWVDESSPAAATHFSGATLLEAEALLHARRPDAVVLRLGGIYGPGRASLVAALARGEATLGPGDEHFVNRFHREDCAGALAFLVDLAEPARLYLGVDDEPASRREVMSYIAARLGVPSPSPSAETVTRPRRGGSHKRCSNARLRAAGYVLTYPTYREGYAALVDELERSVSPRA